MVFCMVTVQQLKDELSKDLELFRNDGTKYRQETTELSLQVLESMHTLIPFMDRTRTLKIVSNELTTADLERKKDVAKMLNVTYVQMNTRQNYSSDFKRELAQRKRQRGKITLELTK